MATVRIVVTGANGRLGAYLIDRLASPGRIIHAWHGRSQPIPHLAGSAVWSSVDLESVSSIERALEAVDPEIVFHLAAVSSADAVAADPARAWAVNVEAVKRIADWCIEREKRLVFTSTDLVYDGDGSLYRENDPPRPILQYGRTKLAAERYVLNAPRGLAARLSLLYGFAKSANPGFFDRAITALQRGESQRFFDDEFRTPLDYDSAARALNRLASTSAVGIVHVAGRERMSRWELMDRAARALGINPDLVLRNSRESARLAEPRPRDVSLDTGRIASLLPDFDPPNIEESMARTRRSTAP